MPSTVKAWTWLAVLGCCCGSLLAADWPTFRHDNARSAVSPEALAAAALEEHWIHRAAGPPQPAWAGPARWDAYHNIRVLRSMRNYDPVFHVVVAGDSLWFGSSADDSVRCLEAATGRQRWCFTTDGPVRIAPASAGDKLYFGSDDGFAYCLRAADGELLWKHAPVAAERRILNNGRLISPWPCRTGVLVDGGTAYFAAGMFPWKESYLCAVDAESGKPEGERRYVKSQPGPTMEGALLASTTRLFVPQGRVPPLLFDRGSGNPLGSLKGGGGCFVLLTADDRVLHGPGNKTGWITDSNAQTRETVATVGGANAMVVAGTTAWLLTDDRLAALDRTSKKTLWSQPCQYPYALILAGDTLFAGGRDRVAAFGAADGSPLWQHPVDGKAHGLAVAGGGLFVSTDEGVIYCFRPGAKPGTSSGDPPSQAAEETAEPDATASAAEPPAPIPPVDDKDLLGRWVFQSGGIEGTVVQDQAGSLDGPIAGRVKLEPVGDVEALAMDGRTQHVTLTDNHTTAELPRRQITAEAWVRVDAPLQWGGIVGVAQDNGSFERGWLLGYNNRRFSFAVAAAEGPGRLTYLPADADFQPGRGYHVVGTYDGAEMRLYVDGQLKATSAAQKGDVHYPPKAFYEIGAYHDDDEFFRLAGLVHEVRVYRRVLSAEEVREHHVSKPLDWPTPPQPPKPPETIALALGSYFELVGPGSAVVRWRTEKPSPTILEYGAGEEPRRIEEPAPKTEHEAQLTGLAKDTVYRFIIRVVQDGREGVSAEFECDTFFHYGPAAVPDRPCPWPDDEMAALCAAAADRILSASGIRRGICLVLGSGRGRLCYELARRSELRVIGVDTDADRVAAARRALLAAGVYGGRVAIHRVNSLDALPSVGSFANLIVSEATLSTGQCVSTAGEVARLLRPGGGTICIGQPPGAPNKLTRAALQTWLASGSLKADITDGEDGLWARAVRPPLDGAGDWTHLYGRADNSAYGGESLAGARTAGDLDVQWVGRPGPRAQADRNGRKPSPLSTGGRLFMQGLHRILALDAYNGTVLWSLEIPPFERFNMPRDCSNWCADEEHLYCAVRDKCWRIDAATGRVAGFFDPAPGPETGWDHDWGYVGRSGNKLFGSAVKSGTSWTNFWGGAGWYDSKSGPVTFKICSDRLFALDPASGRPAWVYARGLVINPTITIGEGRVAFVECRNPKVIASAERRVGMPELWQDQFLVALDARTGTRLWERPIDTADGTVVFYLAYGGDKLVLVASDRQYNVYAFNAADGSPAWDIHFPWPSDNHGGHMSRPAIVGQTLYVRPKVIDLATGQFREASLATGGCGTYATTDHTVIFRRGTVTMWDAGSGQTSTWPRLRPDCWLSTIPAAGMLLSPEGGGGCSCGSWLETSIGFMPQQR